MSNDTKKTVIVPADSVVLRGAQHALDAHVNYFAAQLLVESVERDLGERTLVMRVQGKTRSLLVVVTPCEVEPAHAIDCDLDEDCTCGAASDRSDSPG